MIGDLLHKIYVALVVLLFFGASVFVHEFGHYWVARLRRMRVLGFSIGFGPKIFSWRDGAGVEWAVRWIPAGGFVRLPQMITSSAIEGSTGDDTPPASPFSKILVALAGPTMNVFFAFAVASLVWFVGLPVAVNPSIIGYVEPGSPEAALGIREGDRIVRVDDRPVRSWQDVQRFTVLARTNRIPVQMVRDGVAITHLLTAQVNPAFGFKLLNLDPKDHPVIDSLTSGGAAEAAGLRVGDQFISFGGVPIVGQSQLVELIRSRPGAESPVEISRGSERLKLQVTPRLDPDAKVGRIGVALSPSRVLVYQLQRPGPTPWEQVNGVLEQMGDVISALSHSKETGITPKDMSGPVGIFGKLAADANVDIRLALGFIVMVNINLALLNLLPIPVLDGGHIIMALYEILTRRRVSARFQETVTAAFAVLLLSFMLYVSFFDVVKRGPLFRALFKQETVVEPAPPSAR
jgi:regulator of sigma E protease